MTNKNVMKVLEILIEKTNNLEETTEMLEYDMIQLQERMEKIEKEIYFRWNVIYTLLLVGFSITLYQEILTPLIQWILQLF